MEDTARHSCSRHPAAGGRGAAGCSEAQAPLSPATSPPHAPIHPRRKPCSLGLHCPPKRYADVQTKPQDLSVTLFVGHYLVTWDTEDTHRRSLVSRGVLRPPGQGDRPGADPPGGSTALRAPPSQACSLLQIKQQKIRNTSDTAGPGGQGSGGACAQPAPRTRVARPSRSPAPLHPRLLIQGGCSPSSCGPHFTFRLTNERTNGPCVWGGKGGRERIFSFQAEGLSPLYRM